MDEMYLAVRLKQLLAQPKTHTGRTWTWQFYLLSLSQSVDWDSYSHMGLQRYYGGPCSKG